MIKKIVFITIISVLISSCVSPKIHNALVSDFETTQRNLSELEKENLKLYDQSEELSSNIRLLNKLFDIFEII